MKTRQFISAMASAVILLAVSANSFAQELPKCEFRGAWLHIVGNKRIATQTSSQLQEKLIATLDSLKLAGCNAVLFQVRPDADAFYDSKLEPWTRYLTGVQGRAPEPYWDPLAFAVEECHKRGMELHAWCNPYRVTSEESDILCDDHLYHRHPELFVKYGKQWYFNPGEPASRKFVTKVMVDIVKRYDVDAIHFDDYFYPYPIEGQEFDDEASFRKYGAKQGFDKDHKADWRRDNVTILMRDINIAIKKVKPWIRLGISPFGIHRNKKDTPDGSGSETNGLSCYEALYADIPLWVEKGYIDYNVPQIYWEIGHPRADYEVLIKWWSANTPKAHFYVGQNVSSLNKKDLNNPETTQLRRKMELVRTLPNVHGNVWWPGWSVVRNHAHIADSLIQVYQKYPALIPAYSDIDSTAPKPVENLRKEGYLLKWNQNRKDASDKMQKAHFYVIYYFPAGVEVDTNNSKYIIKITRDTQFSIAENCHHKDRSLDHKKGSRYVVSVVDKCWNESRGNIVWEETKDYCDYYYPRLEEFASQIPVDSKDYVFLGNSLTQGGKWEEYFPEVQAELEKKGGSIRNRGIIGDTADGIYDRLEEILNGKPAKLFFLTGANDISHNLSADTIVGRIEKVIDRVQQECPKTRIYVESLLPFNESFKRYKALNGKTHVVNETNAVLEKMCERRGVEFIYIHDLFLEDGSKEVLKASISPDGLHLKPEGYQIWKEGIRKWVEE
ncbi:MAG: family 10 glycosylhydrolase [Bacteroidales bacterium]|nr:family 10 glycosylhydrolase [Candidatus Egerieousia equi]